MLCDCTCNTIQYNGANTAQVNEGKLWCLSWGDPTPARHIGQKTHTSATRAEAEEHANAPKDLRQPESLERKSRKFNSQDTYTKQSLRHQDNKNYQKGITLTGKDRLAIVNTVMPPCVNYATASPGASAACMDRNIGAAC